MSVSNLKRVPLIPTVIVLAAVAVMIALGFWQLARLEAKQAQLARYAIAGDALAEVAWPTSPDQARERLFRRSRIDCVNPGADAPLAGHNAQGTTGWAHSFSCALPQGGRADVVIGWSKDLQPRQWRGGVVSGIIAPAMGDAVRLIADPPLAGLAANARPDPAAVPNNHLSYAMQWFLFAATALVIYGLALRKRLRGA